MIRSLLLSSMASHPSPPAPPPPLHHRCTLALHRRAPVDDTAKHRLCFCCHRITTCTALFLHSQRRAPPSKSTTARSADATPLLSFPLW
ncbi:hypothetical protein U1Q18_030453 [Sarracenia purpurea var. burkii]